MTDRVAILLGSPFTEDIYDRIGVPCLSETFDVDVIDCTRWVRSGTTPVAFQRHAYPHFFSTADLGGLAELLAVQRPAYAIDFIGKGPFTRAIQRALRQLGIRHVAQRISPVPLPHQLDGLAAIRLASIGAFARRGAHGLVRMLRNQHAHPPDVALLAGEESMDHWTSAARTILWTASPDYFTLRALQRVRNGTSRRFKVAREPFALFIDDCLALSPDYALTGHAPPIRAATYFSMLTRSLNDLEDRLGLPIVIAAHPNGKEIPKYAELFGGRAVHFGATAELALECTVAVTHYSTAVSYPVLLRKPIIVLNAQCLRHTRQGHYIATVAKLLNARVVFMDAESPAVWDLGLLSRVDEDAYAAYERRYITTDRSDDESPFDVFTRFATARTPHER